MVLNCLTNVMTMRTIFSKECTTFDVKLYNYAKNYNPTSLTVYV